MERKVGFRGKFVPNIHNFAKRWNEHPSSMELLLK